MAEVKKEEVKPKGLGTGALEGLSGGGLIPDTGSPLASPSSPLPSGPAIPF